MIFYCPNCRQEYDVTSHETITTLTGRIAYKALCPTCGQDMAEFIPGEHAPAPAAAAPAETPAPTPVTASAPIAAPAPSPSVDATTHDSLTPLPLNPQTQAVDNSAEQVDLQALQAELNQAATEAASLPVKDSTTI